MTRRERWQLLSIWFFLGLMPLFMRPLWEPDESRYAEIPREMLALGDWLTPRLNYVLYFEKPPLQYWLSAISMRLLGPWPFAARLPLALASLISLWCVWRLARRLGARQPIWAAFMLGTAILSYICGQILTLDALFSAFQVLALVAGIEAVAARFEGDQGTGWSLLAFGALALAMLTKGLAAPVLVGGILLASLPMAWSSPRLRSALVKTLLDPLGWLLFAAVAAPWFILVDRANPGHATFFFIHEHFARYTSHVHNRAGAKNPILDKFYFTGFLALGVLPWLSASLLGLRRGVAFLRRAAVALGRFAAIEAGSSLAIVERHHSAKADAPSGTAKTLAANECVSRCCRARTLPHRPALHACTMRACSRRTIASACRQSMLAQSESSWETAPASADAVAIIQLASSCRYSGALVPNDHQDVSSLARGASCVPYPDDCRPAFAFSWLLCPLVRQQALPPAYPLRGEQRGCHVPRCCLAGVGAAFTPVVCVPLPGDSTAPGPDHCPFGPGLSAALACSS